MFWCEHKLPFHSDKSLGVRSILLRALYKKLQTPLEKAVNNLHFHQGYSRDSSHSASYWQFVISAGTFSMISNKKTEGGTSSLYF